MNGRKGGERLDLVSLCVAGRQFCTLPVFHMPSIKTRFNVVYSLIYVYFYMLILGILIVLCGDVVIACLSCVFIKIRCIHILLYVDLIFYLHFLII